jgi:hypothetical protein
VYHQTLSAFIWSVADLLRGDYKQTSLASRGIQSAPRAEPARCVPIIERALIRYFLSEGRDLVNKAGTRLRRHEIATVGRHPNLFIPKLMFVDRGRGE